MNRIHAIQAQRQHTGCGFCTSGPAHGLAATIDAFAVSRRSLFAWKKAYYDAKGNTAALNTRSRAPLRGRQRLAGGRGVLDRLIALRTEYPALSFEKPHIFLLGWCQPRGLHCPCVSSLRRFAKTDKRLMPVKHRPAPNTRMKPQDQRRPKGYAPKAPGQGVGVGVDTIEIDGSGLYSRLRRYVVTFKDMYSPLCPRSGCAQSTRPAHRQALADRAAVLALQARTGLQ